jgi:hypothetical protein
LRRKNTGAAGALSSSKKFKNKKYENAFLVFCTKFEFVQLDYHVTLQPRPISQCIERIKALDDTHDLSCSLKVKFSGRTQWQHKHVNKGIA